MVRAARSEMRGRKPQLRWVHLAQSNATECADSGGEGLRDGSAVGGQIDSLNGWSWQWEGGGFVRTEMRWVPS